MKRYKCPACGGNQYTSQGKRRTEIESIFMSIILEDDAYGNPHLYGVYSYANRKEGK